MSSHVTFDLTPLEPVWLALLIAGGQVGLPILILTFLFSKRVQAHATLVNFCCTWVLYSFSYCLLVYTGQVGRASPNMTVCQTQVAMIHGAPPMVTTAGLFLVINVWSTFHDLDIYFVRGHSLLRKLVIVLPPYISFFSFALLYGLQARDHTASLSQGHGVYCSLDVKPLHRFLVPGFSCGIIAIILGFEITILCTFIKRWQHIKRVFPLKKNRPSISLSIRVAIFSMYSGATLGVCLMLLADAKQAAPYMIQASLPLAAFIAFSNQKEVLATWCFWRKQKVEMPSGPLVPDRKMSSGRAAYPHTPTSADLETGQGTPWDWRDRTTITSITGLHCSESEVTSTGHQTPEMQERNVSHQVSIV